MNEIVLEATDFDVKLGRGKGIQLWSGNVRYRGVIEKYRNESRSWVSQHESEKETTIKKILDELGEKTRFLRSADTPAVGFTVLPKDQMREKIKQALREKPAVHKMKTKKIKKLRAPNLYSNDVLLSATTQQSRATYDPGCNPLHMIQPFVFAEQPPLSPSVVAASNLISNLATATPIMNSQGYSLPQSGLAAFAASTTAPRSLQLQFSKHVPFLGTQAQAKLLSSPPLGGQTTATSPMPKPTQEPTEAKSFEPPNPAIASRRAMATEPSESSLPSGQHRASATFCVQRAVSSRRCASATQPKDTESGIPTLVYDQARAAAFHLPLDASGCKRPFVMLDEEAYANEPLPSSQEPEKTHPRLSKSPRNNLAPKIVVFEATEHDVKLGRGFQLWPGNVRYREVIDKYRGETGYVTRPQSDKNAVVRKVLEELGEKTRFLRVVDNPAGGFLVLPELHMREKIKQALREKAPESKTKKKVKLFRSVSEERRFLEEEFRKGVALTSYSKVALSDTSFLSKQKQKVGDSVLISPQPVPTLGVGSRILGIPSATNDLLARLAVATPIPAASNNCSFSQAILSAAATPGLQYQLIGHRPMDIQPQPASPQRQTTSSTETRKKLPSATSSKARPIPQRRACESKISGVATPVEEDCAFDALESLAAIAATRPMVNVTNPTSLSRNNQAATLRSISPHAATINAHFPVKPGVSKNPDLVNANR